MKLKHIILGAIATIAPTVQSQNDDPPHTVSIMSIENTMPSDGFQFFQRTYIQLQAYARLNASIENINNKNFIVPPRTDEDYDPFEVIIESMRESYETHGPIDKLFLGWHSDEQRRGIIGTSVYHHTSSGTLRDTTYHLEPNTAHLLAEAKNYLSEDAIIYYVSCEGGKKIESEETSLAQLIANTIDRTVLSIKTNYIGNFTLDEEGFLTMSSSENPRGILSYEKYVDSEENMILRNPVTGRLYSYETGLVAANAPSMEIRSMAIIDKYNAFPDSLENAGISYEGETDLDLYMIFERFHPQQNY